MMPYCEKMVISGRYIEIWKYGQNVFSSNLKKKQNENNQSESDKIRDRLDNLERTRANIRHWVNTNDNLNKFLTLTFKKNMTDISRANYDFKIFRQKLERYIGQDLKYIAVMELQKRGAVHYHTLCELPFIDKLELSKMWGHGFIDIKRIDHIRNIGSYMSKYLTKSLLLPDGKKRFFKSQNLKEPLELKSQNNIDFFREKYNLDSLVTCSYESEYATAHYGTCKYQIYELPQRSFEKAPSNL